MSKSDPFGIMWGPLPIYLPFSTDELNGARLVAELHLHSPPSPGAAQSTPFFRRNDGASFTKAQLDSLLAHMLKQHRSLEEMKGLLWHSFRV